MHQQEEWFSTWFNSLYYRILYKNHNIQEAQVFIDRLIEHLQTKLTYNLLDSACGKDQYATYLNQKGFHGAKFDLAENNNTYAAV